MRRERVVVAFLSVWFSLPAHGFDDQATSTADTGEGRPSRADADRWTTFAPESIEFPTDESAEILADQSVQFSLPSPSWSESEFHFAFEQRRTIGQVRLEILADTRFPDQRLGRQPNKKLMPFELKPMFQPRSSNRERASRRCWNSGVADI